MRIDWWTLALQTINVLVLIWILGRFLFRPVAAIVAARRAEAVRFVDEARAAKVAAEAARDAATAETARQAATRTEALAAATAEAETAKATLLAAARVEADGLRATAEAEIERSRATERTVAADRASRLALDIAAKLMTRLPDEARVGGFVAGLAEAVGALPSATRATFGSEGPVRLKTARAPTPSEEQAMRDALATVLGRAIDITFETDAGVVAGVELETPHAVVRNSFRADLERLGGELTRHDQA